MENFSLQAVDLAENSIKTVFGWLKDEIVSAAIVDRVATEGFFEISKAGPRVTGSGVFGGDAPKVKFL